MENCVIDGPRKRILVVVAHPDDEVLGCGATMARLASLGHEVQTLILGEGITSRADQRNTDQSSEALAQLKRDAQRANSLLGVSKVHFSNFPDNRFDSVALLDVVKSVEEIKKAYQPQVIFTHFEGDLNIDHQVANRAVLTATRPLFDEGVKEIYAVEVMSSTEWKFPLRFSPDTFIDVSNFLDSKIKAMEAYSSEARAYPHPRSSEALRQYAQLWGVKLGVPFAEAFVTLRRVL